MRSTAEIRTRLPRASVIAVAAMGLAWPAVGVAAPTGAAAGTVAAGAAGSTGPVLPGTTLSGLPGRQRVEHGDHGATRGRRERHLARLDGRGHHRPPSRLRPVAQPEEALRHPLGGRVGGHGVRPGQVHLRLGKRSGALPADVRHAHRGRVGPPRTDGRPDRSATSPACTLFETYDTHFRSGGGRRRDRGPSGTWTRTPCGRPAGPRRTPPDCRSCRAWSTTTRSPPAPWTMPSDSRPPAPRSPTCGRPGTRPGRTTRRARPWAPASAWPPPSPCRLLVRGLLPDGAHHHEDLRPHPGRQRQQLVLPGDGGHPVDGRPRSTSSSRSRRASSWPSTSRASRWTPTPDRRSSPGRRPSPQPAADSSAPADRPGGPGLR